MLLLRDHKSHWLPFSLLFVNEPLEEKTIVTIDIPRWLADEHKFDSGFTPVTKEGKEHNKKLGFVDFGIEQPSLAEYLSQQHEESIRRNQLKIAAKRAEQIRKADSIMHKRLMKQVQISESQREMLRNFTPQKPRSKRKKTGTAIAEIAPG